MRELIQDWERYDVQAGDRFEFHYTFLPGAVSDPKKVILEEIQDKGNYKVDDIIINNTDGLIVVSATAIHNTPIAAVFGYLFWLSIASMVPISIYLMRLTLKEVYKVVNTETARESIDVFKIGLYLGIIVSAYKIITIFIPGKK